MEIIPNCRYGHGDLLEAANEHDKQWGLLSGAKGPAYVFLGRLFVCAKCGYTEFFDDNPEATSKNYGQTS